MLSCTLFVQMGLSGAIQRLLHLRFRVLSCPRCASFWVCLVFLILSGGRIVDSVAASFLLAYVSQWLALLLDALAAAYNMLYENIIQASGASEDEDPDNRKDNSSKAHTDEVSEV